MSKEKFIVIVIALCLAAAFLYNSWPLGYWLDGQVARSGLASDLEVASRPYSGLFISGDVLAGLCALLAGIIMRVKLWPASHSRARSRVYLGLIVFGFFTALDALLPAQCTLSPLLKCGSAQGQGLSIDAIANTIAAVGLLISLISSGRQEKARSRHAAVLLAWTTLGVAFAWVVSSLLFVLLALTHRGAAHLLQEIQLSLSGAALIVIATNVYTVLKIDNR